VTEPRDLTDLVPADVRTELQELLGVKVVRSELTYLLVRLDKEYTKRRPAGASSAPRTSSSRS
jgi:hypothetical protein